MGGGAPRLSTAGQLYVATVALVAALGQVVTWPGWHVVLVVLTLPLSLLAMWVAFYAAVAVGYVVDPGLAHAAGRPAWPAVVVWVAVWTFVAWINAQIAAKIRRSGWAALRVGPPMDTKKD